MLPSNPQQVPVQLSQLSPFHTSTLAKGAKMLRFRNHSLGQISGPIQAEQAPNITRSSRNSIAHQSSPLALHHPNSEGTTWTVSRRPPGLCSIHISKWLWDAMSRQLNAGKRKFTTIYIKNKYIYIYYINTHIKVTILCTSAVANLQSSRVREPNSTIWFSP